MTGTFGAAPYLSARGLGEPESPLALEGVLDIEVIFVVEHSHRLAAVLDLARILDAVGRDGDGRKIDLLVHVWRFRHSSHCRWLFVCGICEVRFGLVSVWRESDVEVWRRGKKNLELSKAGFENRGAAAVGWMSKKANKQKKKRLAVAERNKVGRESLLFGVPKVVKKNKIRSVVCSWLFKSPNLLQAKGSGSSSSASDASIENAPLNQFTGHWGRRKNVTFGSACAVGVSA